jgi:uncharacterized protein YndB with AHSA1/START domain
MTPTPDHPLRMELSFELPGTAEQVWDAIATANGISSWFIPTTLEERQGGAICFHMGETDSPGTITGWEPPHRFAYVEPNWAELTGHDASAVTPLATEFLVEARSGGACVVRVVTSAFGTGADWEQEFFDEMEKGWRPFFEHLRLYLTHFPGQQVTSMSVDADVAAAPGPVSTAMRAGLGIEQVGQAIDTRGITGQVERLGDTDLLLRVTEPVPGLLALFAYDKGDGVTTARVEGYLFSSDAPEFVERERSGWQDWLKGVAAAV